MNSRERVKRCLDLDRPDRVPRDLWELPIAAIEHGEEKMKAFRKRWPGDLVNPKVPQPALKALCKGDAYEVGEFRDEWGCIFDNIQAGVIGEVKRPVLDDWSKLDDLRPPVEALELDIEAVNRFCAESDRYVMSNCCARPFERIQFLRGSENVYIDIAEDADEYHELLKRVHDFYVKELELWSRTDVDGLRFMDDWGSQRTLLISPARWREQYKPLYAEYARIAHDAGKKIWMHSDGNIQSVIGDLVEIGIDALNSQLFCMDIEEIGRQYAGKITFWGEIDRQHVLPFGTVEEACAAVQRIYDSFYRPEGGVIAQFELAAGAKLENADAVFETWEKLGGK